MNSVAFAPPSASPIPGGDIYLRAAKRQAVLRQVRAQQQALVLLAQSLPLPAALLEAVGQLTAEHDPQVAALWSALD